MGDTIREQIAWLIHRVRHLLGETKRIVTTLLPLKLDKPTSSQTTLVGTDNLLVENNSIWKRISAFNFKAYFKSFFKVYHGFFNPNNSTFATFNNATRTFQINANAGYDIAINGDNFQITENKSIQIGTGLGQHFIWYYVNNEIPTLATGQTPWNILDITAIPVATVYWDGVTGIQADERHSAGRNLIWHNTEHKTVGTRYVSGFTPTPTFNQNNTFSFTGGVINDEDIILSLIGNMTSGLIGYRRTDALSFVFEKGSTFAKLVGGELNYDNNGTLTPVNNNRYMNIWAYATNHSELGEQVVFIIGQEQFTTISAAQSSTLPTLTSISVAEWKLLYRIICRKTVSVPFAVTQVDPLYTTSTGLAVNAGAPSTISAGNVTTTITTTLPEGDVQSNITNLDERIINLVSTGSIYDAEIIGLPETSTIELVNGKLIIFFGISYDIHNYTVVLPTPLNDKVNECIMFIRIGETLPVLTLPAGVIWYSDNEIKVNTNYLIYYQQIFTGGGLEIRAKLE